MTSHDIGDADLERSRPTSSNFVGGNHQPPQPSSCDSDHRGVMFTSRAPTTSAGTAAALDGDNVISEGRHLRTPRQIDTSIQPMPAAVTWSSPTVKMRRRIVWRRRLSLESAIESSNCWRCRHPVTLTVDKQTDAPAADDEFPDDSRRSAAQRKKSVPTHATRKESKACHVAAAGPGNGELRGEVVIDLDELSLINRHADASSRMDEVNVYVFTLSSYVSLMSMSRIEHHRETDCEFQALLQTFCQALHDSHLSQVMCSCLCAVKWKITCKYI